jgi:hypothetical protein
VAAGRWNATSHKFGGDGVRRCDAARLDVSYHRGKRDGSGIGSLFPYFAASRTSFRGSNHCSLTICEKVSGRSGQEISRNPAGSTRLLVVVDPHVRELAVKGSRRSGAKSSLDAPSLAHCHDNRSQAG